MQFCNHRQFKDIIKVITAAYHAADEIADESIDQEVILEALKSSIVGRVANWIMYQGIDGGHRTAIMTRIEVYRMTLFRDYNWNDDLHGIFLARLLDHIQTRLTTYIDEDLMFVDMYVKQQVLSEVKSVIDQLAHFYEIHYYGDLLASTMAIYGGTTLHNLNATKPAPPSEYDAFVFFRDLVTNHRVFDCIEFGYAFVLCNRSVYATHILDSLKAAKDNVNGTLNIQSVFMDVDRREMFVGKPIKELRLNSWQKLIQKSAFAVCNDQLQKVRHKRIVITY
jgi:hypothetical protein